MVWDEHRTERGEMEVGREDEKNNFMVRDHWLYGHPACTLQQLRIGALQVS